MTDLEEKLGTTLTGIADDAPLATGLADAARRRHRVRRQRRLAVGGAAAALVVAVSAAVVVGGGGDDAPVATDPTDGAPVALYDALASDGLEVHEVAPSPDDIEVADALDAFSSFYQGDAEPDAYLVEVDASAETSLPVGTRAWMLHVPDVTIDVAPPALPGRGSDLPSGTVASDLVAFIDAGSGDHLATLWVGVDDDPEADVERDDEGSATTVKHDGVEVVVFPSWNKKQCSGLVQFSPGPECHGPLGSEGVYFLRAATFEPAMEEGVLVESRQGGTVLWGGYALRGEYVVFVTYPAKETAAPLLSLVR